MNAPPDDPQPKRFWWWPAHQLTHRWCPGFLGGDEFGNRTVAIRLPGGLLITALNVPLRTTLSLDGGTEC